MSSTQTKLILVIGATGAQGMAVVDKLLEPSADGTASPYSVRALTRDPNSRRAAELKEKGVECVKGPIDCLHHYNCPLTHIYYSFHPGAFDDFPSVKAAMRGVYGVWANTDGFTVGEEKEVWCGIRLFEIAKEVGSVRHYVWSNLDYVSKVRRGITFNCTSAH